MIGTLIYIIQTVAWILSIVLIADVVVSYFMSPYQPIRAFLDRIIQPLLRPIRRFLPTFGGLDFSPIVLLLLVQLVETVLINILTGIG
jgi:YggT family protein